MTKQSKQVSAEEMRKFGLVTGAMFAGIFGVVFPLFKMLRHGEYMFHWWPWAVLGALGAWGSVHPKSLIYIYKPWMKFAEALGWVNTRIILFVVFFLLFFPIGLVLRLCGHDAMRRRFDASLYSYRNRRVPQDKDHMEQPY
jgi:hypothetical protein